MAEKQPDDRVPAEEQRDPGSPPRQRPAAQPVDVREAERVRAAQRDLEETNF